MKGPVGKKVRWQTSSPPLMLKRQQKIRRADWERECREQQHYTAKWGEGKVDGRMRVSVQQRWRSMGATMSVSKICFLPRVKCTATGVCQSSAFSFVLRFKPTNTWKLHNSKDLHADMCMCVCVCVYHNKWIVQPTSFCPAAEWKNIPWHCFCTANTNTPVHCRCSEDSRWLARSL